MADQIQLAEAVYRAFAAGDRRYVEDHLADEFTFSAPPDPLLDRAGFFERCWPGSGTGQEFEFVRLIESGAEVIVTYETRLPNAPKGRNTEILTFDGDRLTRAEVYFGWTIE